LVVIDFDDMAMGPPVQDLWMLLPDHAPKCRHEIACILEGYEEFRPFDPFSLRLIEPLRAMRMLYYLAWCSLQADDHSFRHRFRDWGSDAFWSREVAELRKQLDQIQASLHTTGRGDETAE
jgi:Ser/Thr protein kinase RdoA (MazF antagonist)